VQNLWIRVLRLLRGFLGLFISGIEEQNPEALLEAAKQDFKEKMAEYNRSLARLAGVTERLRAQIRLKTTRAGELERRIVANVRAGNQELAGSLARELQETKADLQHDTEELKDAEAAYNANIRNVKLVQREFDDKIRRLERWLSQVKIKEAQAEAAATLSGISFSVGDTGETLQAAQEVLEKRYELAAGKARVTKDLANHREFDEKEAERKALEQVALSEFLAERGIEAKSLPPSSPGSTPPSGR